MIRSGCRARTTVRPTTSHASVRTTIASRSLWAGFKPEEITVTAEQNMLTVEGRKVENGGHEYLFQGISGRPFRRQFNLADYVEVTGASLENGLLQIELMRKLPEAMKPRRIAIDAGAGNDHQQIEHSQAA